MVVRVEQTDVRRDRSRVEPHETTARTPKDAPDTRSGEHTVPQFAIKGPSLPPAQEARGRGLDADAFVLTVFVHGDLQTKLRHA